MSEHALLHQGAVEGVCTVDKCPSPTGPRQIRWHVRTLTSGRGAVAKEALSISQSHCNDVRLSRHVKCSRQHLTRSRISLRRPPTSTQKHGLRHIMCKRGVEDGKEERRSIKRRDDGPLRPTIKIINSESFQAAQTTFRLPRRLQSFHNWPGIFSQPRCNNTVLYRWMLMSAMCLNDCSVIIADTSLLSIPTSSPGCAQYTHIKPDFCSVVQFCRFTRLLVDFSSS